jgi:hypothetical protein
MFPRQLYNTGLMCSFRMVYLVPELSILCGLTERMRSDFKVMQDLAKVTRVVPQQRQEELLKIIHRIKSVDDKLNLDIVGKLLDPKPLIFLSAYRPLRPTNT